MEDLTLELDMIIFTTIDETPNNIIHIIDIQYINSIRNIKTSKIVEILRILFAYNLKKLLSLYPKFWFEFSLSTKIN